MKELEALSSQILKRVKEEGQQKVVEKEQELSLKLEESRMRFVEHQRVQTELMESRSKEAFERQSQSLANAKRNKLLAEKQRILSKVYQSAVEKMTEWDEATFQSFVQSVLKQFDASDLNIVPGKKTAHYFTPSFVSSLEETNSALTVASETIPNKAGFIVEVGGIDYNFFFDQIVAEIKKDFSPKLASLAFEENE